MTFYCPNCGTPLIRVGEYTFFCINCEKKVGALVRELSSDSDVE